MLEILNLNHEFNEKIIFRNVKLTVNDGEIIWIQGDNGSGKTTLFRILSGLLAPVTNAPEPIEITLNHKKTELSQLKHEINYIPSKPYLFEYLSGKDNVEYLIALFDLHDKKAQIYENLRQLNMEEDFDREVNTYSLGMKAKLYFATVIERDTSLILIDELLNNIDAESLRVANRIMFDKRTKENRSFIFASHTTLTESNADIKKIYIRDRRLVAE